MVNAPKYIFEGPQGRPSAHGVLCYAYLIHLTSYDNSYTFSTHV